MFMDLLNYFVQGILFVVFFQSGQYRFVFKIRNAAEMIFIAQYMAVQLFLHNADVVKRLLYEQNMIMSDSRQGTLLVMASMFITYTVSITLLKESKLKTLYYVITFYSILELVKFTLYPVLLQTFQGITNLNLYLYSVKGTYGVDAFYRITSIAEVIWNILQNVIILFISYKVLLQIKEYLKQEVTYQKSELIFLMIPSGIGLLLCFMLRSMMFSMKGTDVHTLLDSHPEMNFCIPCISILCIIMIVLSTRMLRQLMAESKKKVEVSIYQNRIKEMEQHIGDIESLYAGIRGMKHDMKNYIADMDALMKQNTENTMNKAAFKQYLSSLQTSVEQLDMKYKTGNPVTDVIIQRYVQLTDKNKIDFSVDFMFPAYMNMDAFDLSIILNNALENAMEACKKVENGKKYIDLTAYRSENMFFVIVQNSFAGKLAKDKQTGRWFTTKTSQNEHGLGLQNIEMCADKYFGKAETMVKGDVFKIAVMLQKRE